MITRRHIRYDWDRWLDLHDTKTVRTLCDVRTRPELAGIPGITEQDLVVQVGKTGSLYSGWCGKCASALADGIEEVLQKRDLPKTDKVLWNHFYQPADEIARRTMKLHGSAV